MQISNLFYKRKWVNTMVDKKVTKISLSTFLLIIAIIIIAIMGFFIYKLNSEKVIEVKKSADLQAQVSSLNSTVSNLQSKINTISETVNSLSTPVQSSNSNSSKTASTSITSNLDDIKYEISKKKNQNGEEVIVVIKATKDDKTTTKEFEMSATIVKTEVIDILGCGKVVLVAETGGEYYAFKLFRLSEDYTNDKTRGIVEAYFFINFIFKTQ